MPEFGQVQILSKFPLREGIVSSILPISETGMYDIYNFSVEIDGLESCHGWEIGEGITSDIYSTFHGVDTFSDNNNRFWMFVWNSMKQYAFSPYSHRWFDITIPDATLGILEVPQAAPMGDKLYVVDKNTGLWSYSWIEGSLLSEVNRNVKAQTLMYIGYRLLAGNLVLWDTEVPNAIRWSNLGDPLTWDDLAYMELPDNEKIFRMLPLSHGNNVGAIYTQNSIYIVSYTGNDVTPFAIQKIASSVFIHNPRAVAVVSSNEFYGHAYASPQGAFLFTGNEAILISETIRPLWREFFDKATKIEVFYNPVREEIYFADYGQKLALVYQLRFRSWYKRSWNLVGIGLVSEKNAPYKPLLRGVKEFMNYRNFTVMYPQGYRDYDSEFYGYIETPVMILGSNIVGQITKLLLWIFSRGTFAEISGTVKITFATSNNFFAIASQNYLQYQDVVKTTVIQAPISQLLRRTFLATDEINLDISGKYFRMKIEVFGLSEMLNISGFSVVWQPIQYVR